MNMPSLSIKHVVFDPEKHLHKYIKTQSGLSEWYEVSIKNRIPYLRTKTREEAEAAVTKLKEIYGK